jgi:alkylhydroperoxidase family enzyme
MIRTLLISAAATAWLLAAPPGHAQADRDLPADVDSESLSRLPALTRDQLDDAGKAAYELVVGDGPRPLTGPAAVSMHSPKVAEAFHILNQYLRNDGVVEPRYYEVAILQAAWEFEQAYEWSAHEAAARRLGVPEAVIETIKYDREPHAGLEDKDLAIIRFARALLREHAVDSALYADVVRHFGEQGMVELATVMGDYIMVGFVLTAADQHLPANLPNTLPERCGPAGGQEFVCGPVNAEDLVRAPGTDWIVASGMAAGGGFYLIDSTTGGWSALAFDARHDALAYPNCPSPPSFDALETHGLNVRAQGGNRAVLYVVGHGAREAIEVFELDGAGERPALTWIGCVTMPEGLAANSVASFADGSLVATVLLMPGRTFADSVAMRPTGAVYKWSPGDDELVLLEGSELPGNNGIEVSADGSEIYVVSSGFQTVVAFSNTNPVRQLRTTTQLPITPDNLHMSPNGSLLTAGMKNDVPECGGPPGPQHDLNALATCPRGTMAIEVDPKTMDYRVLVETEATEAFSNATMVLPAGDRFWIGTFRGDRIAHGPLP